MRTLIISTFLFVVMGLVVVLFSPPKDLQDDMVSAPSPNIVSTSPPPMPEVKEDDTPPKKKAPPKKKRKRLFPRLFPKRDYE